MTSAAASSAASATVTTAKPHAGPGDANCDNLVTIADAVLICRINAEDPNVRISEQGLANADANKDGGITSLDVTWVLRWLAGILK